MVSLFMVYIWDFVGLVLQPPVFIFLNILQNVPVAAFPILYSLFILPNSAMHYTVIMLLTNYNRGFQPSGCGE